MLKKKFRHWLSQRFQFQQQKQLNQRDILIFIYQQGYLYLVLIAITFIAGINYANNLILGFCFLITAILCISFYLTFKQLHQLSIQVVLPEVGRVGEALEIHLYFKQDKPTIRYLKLNVEQQQHQILLSDLEQQITLSFVPSKRGQFHVPDIQLYSTYPLGLVRAWSYLFLKKQVWIAPQAQVFEQEHDVASDAGLPDLDEYRDLRNYQLGDALQTISWKQAARGQGLYVKQFENQVDVHTVEISYAQMPASGHEEKLALMMGLVDRCEQQKTAYVLRTHEQVLGKGCGEQQFIQAQLILAQAEA